METDDAIQTVLKYIHDIPTGNWLEIFGYDDIKRQDFNDDAITASTGGTTLPVYTFVHLFPEFHTALYHLLQNYFGVSDVTAIRLGKCVNEVPKYTHTNRCTFIYYTDSLHLKFRQYRLTDTAVDIRSFTQCHHSRFIQCLTRPTAGYNAHQLTSRDEEDVEDIPTRAPTHQGNYIQQPAKSRLLGQPEHYDISDRMPTISEEDNCHYNEDLDIHNQGHS